MEFFRHRNLLHQTFCCHVLYIFTHTHYNIYIDTQKHKQVNLVEKLVEPALELLASYLVKKNPVCI